MQVSQLRPLMSGCCDVEVNNAVFNSWLPSQTVSDPTAPSSLCFVCYPSRLRTYVPGVGPHMHARTHARTQARAHTCTHTHTPLFHIHIADMFKNREELFKNYYFLVVIFLGCLLARMRPGTSQQPVSRINQKVRVACVSL
jgi:hypothetical protein